jgi:hypothetical protein
VSLRRPGKKHDEAGKYLKDLEENQDNKEVENEIN